MNPLNRLKVIMLFGLLNENPRLFTFRQKDSHHWEGTLELDTKNGITSQLSGTSPKSRRIDYSFNKEPVRVTEYGH